MEYINKLNDKQKEAALFKDGALLILAGAGSGKTSTMTARIANLIENEGISPYNILAVTFTNKAAGEMSERVENIMGRRLSGLWVMTFHAACLRILRQEANFIGYTNSFVVYDPTDQKATVKNILKEKNIDEKKMNISYVLNRISKLKEVEISARDFKEQIDNFIDEDFSKVYDSYEKILKKNNAMDFDDLILNCVRLLRENPDVLEKYQDRFKYIMVDEYQDTNKLQYKFIRMLSKKYGNLCVVGDDDQCIYQWRGADISNILNFEKDFADAKIIKLEQNYRSTSNILQAAHSVIENNRGRKSKKLWTENEQGDKISYHRLSDDRREAEFVAQEIDAIVSRGGKYKDIAILYRTNAQSRGFEDSLTYRHIPYRVIGGMRYYDRMEVKDIVSYMRLILNPDDDLALERIINTPKRSLGKATLDKLKNISNLYEESLFKTLQRDDVVLSLPKKAKESIVFFTNMIVNYHEEKENLKVSNIYDGILLDSGYLKMLEEAKTIESESRIENLMEFKSIIVEMERENEKLELYEFLERIALISDVDNHDANENAVALMTMHSAKGLEFPFVFMPGMEDGLFPSWRSRDNKSQMEEERRLCYVALTRAEKKLYLSHATIRFVYGQDRLSTPSIFLKEIPEKLLDIEVKKERLYFADNYSDEIKTHGDNKKFEKKKTEINTKNTIKLDDNAKKVIDSLGFKVGDKVKHKKFGLGVIKSMDAKKIYVQYVDGTKEMAIILADKLLTKSE